MQNFTSVTTYRHNSLSEKWDTVEPIKFKNRKATFSKWLFGFINRCCKQNETRLNTVFHALYVTALALGLRSG